MSRPTDWGALLLFADPVPGRPEEVEVGARGYLQTADHLADASSNLSRLRDHSHTISQAVEAVLDRADEAALTVGRLSQRYRVAGQALRGYAPELEAAQRDSLVLLQKAQACAGEVKHAGANVAQANVRVMQSLGDPTQAASATSDLVHANAELVRLQGRLLNLRLRLQQVLHRRDEAADAAARQIDSAVENSGVNDSLWDKITDLFTTITHALDEIRKVVEKVVRGIIQDLANRGVAAYKALSRFVETAIELPFRILEDGKVDADEIVLGALLLATLAAGVAANVGTGRDLKFGANDAVAGKPRNVYTQAPGGTISNTGGQRVLDDRASGVPGMISQVGDVTGQPEAAVRIMKVTGADGVERYTVLVPGTREIFGVGGDDPAQMASNAQLRLNLESAQEAAVKAAVEKYVPEGRSVMIVGHSQGGMTAFRLAGDPDFSQRYDVTHVIGAGSPTQDIPLPPGVQGLSIVNRDDPIPRSSLMSERTASGDVRTVYFSNSGEGGLFGGHDSRLYADHLANNPNDPDIRSFSDSASRYSWHPGASVEVVDVPVSSR